jgi:hypothetical protein
MTDHVKLMTKAIDFVIAQEQWLVWVHVTLMDTMEEEMTCRVPVDHDTTSRAFGAENLSVVMGRRRRSASLAWLPIEQSNSTRYAVAC